MKISQLNINQSYLEELKIIGTITLNKKNSDYDNYIKFQNIKIENIFENWKSNIQDYEQYYTLKDENDKYLSMFKISLYVSYVDAFKQMDKLIKEDDNDLFKKYNIKKETEYINFLYNQRNIKKEKVNILSSFNKIKEKYVIQSMVYLIPITILNTEDNKHIKSIEFMMGIL